MYVADGQDIPLLAYIDTCGTGRSFILVPIDSLYATSYRLSVVTSALKRAV